LETGNYPENTVINEAPEEYDETHLDFKTKFYKAKGEVLSSIPFNDKAAQCVNIEEHWDMPVGYVVDQRLERKRLATESPEIGWDDGHPGVSFLGSNAGLGSPTLNYGVTNGSLIVSGVLCGGQAIEAIVDALSIDGTTSKFQGTFRVFLRSELPKTSHAESHADIGSLFITSRKLCTCFKSGKCIEIIPPPRTPPPEREEDLDIIEFIVDEPKIRINKALMTKSAIRQNRAPLAKEFLSKVQSALTRSHNSISRHSLDDKVGFLESDYFKNQIKDILPKEYLETPISKIKGLPERLIKTLGASLTVEQALSIDLARFCRKTGLGVEEASNARRLLLGISIPDDKSGRLNSKEY
ncbi:hypothetical protein ACS8FD_14610, partial [Psychrobacter sp. 1U2]